MAVDRRYHHGGGGGGGGIFSGAVSSASSNPPPPPSPAPPPSSSSSSSLGLTRSPSVQKLLLVTSSDYHTSSTMTRRLRWAKRCLRTIVGIGAAVCGSVMIVPEMEAYTGGIGRVVAEMREALYPPDRPYRLIFTCDAQNLVELLFPEYDRRTYTLNSGVKPTSEDLLVAEYGPAESKCAHLSRDLGGHVLNFPGKMLFSNSEAADTQMGPRGADNTTADGMARLRDGCPDTVRCVDLQGVVRSEVDRYTSEGWRFNYLPPSDRAYVIGPHPDSDRSVRVHLGAKLLAVAAHDSVRDLRWMTDVSRRPRNTGRYFAAFLATNCVPYRDVAAKRIAQLGTLHVGRNYGRCAGRVPDPEDGPPPVMELPEYPTSRPGNALANGRDVYREYKFALVMENTYREGYLTEKLIAAFLGGTVPIWYGGRDALDIFNENAMVYYDVENPEPALARIKLLMEDEEEYRRVQEAPILWDGIRTVERYFSLRDEIGGGYLKRKIRRTMGIDPPPPEEEEEEEEETEGEEMEEKGAEAAEAGTETEEGGGIRGGSDDDDLKSENEGNAAAAAASSAEMSRGRRNARKR